MTVRGDLAVEKIQVMNLSLAQARATLTMEKGVARLSGISVSLYKGQLHGDVTAGVIEPGPPFSLAAQVKGVDFNAFASDFSKGLKGMVYGTLDATLDVHGRGLDTAGLQQNLGGTGSIALRDGKLTSIAALKMLAKGLQTAGGRGVGENETPFKSLSGNFTIANGRLSTSDLALDSPDIDMSAKGDLGLDLTLDLEVAATISGAVSTDMVSKTPNLKYLEDNKGRLEADVQISGTLAAPIVGVDPDMLKRVAKKAGKEQIQKQGKGLLDKFLKKKNQ
jgi:AsmA protein